MGGKGVLPSAASRKTAQLQAKNFSLHISTAEQITPMFMPCLFFTYIFLFPCFLSLQRFLLDFFSCAVAVNGKLSVNFWLIFSLNVEFLI